MSNPKKLTQDVVRFFELSDALSLTGEEVQAMLDLPPDAISRLRADPVDGSAWSLREDKLGRRLDYAIPLLQRMLSAIAS